MAEPGSVRLTRHAARCGEGGQRLPRVAALMVTMLASVAAALWWWF